MGTEETDVEDRQVVPLNRQGTAEPAETAGLDGGGPDAGGTTPGTVAAQNRQGTSTPAD